jgi:leucyl-tRNA synthetase
MFMGPLRESKPWSTKGVEGVYRFLARAYRLVLGADGATPADSSASAERDQLRLLHRTIKRVSEDTEELRFNTAIAAMMEFVNGATKWEARPREALEPFVLLLAPYAPHLAEEMWAALGHEGSLAYAPWPSYDEALTVDAEVELAVQVNGKLRARIVVEAQAENDTVLALGKEAVREFLDGKTLVKEVVVPGRLVNLVVKD